MLTAGQERGNWLCRVVTISKILSKRAVVARILDYQLRFQSQWNPQLPDSIPSHTCCQFCCHISWRCQPAPRLHDSRAVMTSQPVRPTVSATATMFRGRTKRPPRLFCIECDAVKANLQRRHGYDALGLETELSNSAARQSRGPATHIVSSFRLFVVINRAPDSRAS